MGLAGRRPSTAALILALLALLGALCVASLLIGSRPLGLHQVLDAIRTAAPGAPAADTAADTSEASQAAIIVWELRVPRTVLAVGAGATLAVAGAIMQGLTRNPLADPGLLGVNAGSAFAVVLAMALVGASSADQYVWFALAGSAITATLVAILALRSTGGPAHVVLAGVALGASLAACTGIVTLYDATTFGSYRAWVVGSIEGRGLDVVSAVGPVLLAGLACALVAGRALNALALGEDQARSLGLSVTRARLLCLAAVTLLAGGATAAVGPISFIGLVVPHVVRPFVGADQRRLLRVTLVAGPVVLLLADIVGRVISFPGETEAGVVTAFLGGPALLALVIRSSVRR